MNEIRLVTKNEERTFIFYESEDNFSGLSKISLRNRKEPDIQMSLDEH